MALTHLTPHYPTPGTITILRSCPGRPGSPPHDTTQQGHTLCKIYTSITPPVAVDVQMPYFFVGETYAVSSLQDLAEILQTVRGNAHMAVSRHVWQPDPDTPARKWGVRQSDGSEPTLLDREQPWVALDIELGGVTAADFGAAPERHSRAIHALLPPALARAQIYWCVSGSGGIKPGIRLHLYAWLDRPVTSATLSAMLWPYRDAAGIDMSLYDRGRLIFTARPQLPPGTQRPVAQEDGWLAGEPIAKTWDPPKRPTEGQYALIDRDPSNEKNLTAAQLLEIIPTLDAPDARLCQTLLNGDGPIAGSGQAHKHGTRVVGRLRDLFPWASPQSLLDLCRAWGDRAGFDPLNASFSDIADRPARVAMTTTQSDRPEVTSDDLCEAAKRLRRRGRIGESEALDYLATAPYNLTQEQWKTLPALVVRVFPERSYNSIAKGAQVGYTKGTDPQRFLDSIHAAQTITEQVQSAETETAGGRSSTTVEVEGWLEVRLDVVQSDGLDGAPTIKGAFTHQISTDMLAKAWSDWASQACVYSEGYWWEWQPAKGKWGRLEQPPLGSLTQYAWERIVATARQLRKEHGRGVVIKTLGEKPALELCKTISTMRKAQSYSPQHIPWDVRPHWLNTPAGVVDLENGDLFAAHPQHWLRRSTTAVPDNTYRAEFESALLEYSKTGDGWGQDGNLEWVHFLQSVTGYAILGASSPGHRSAKSGGGYTILCQGSPLLHRNGSNGKSTFFGCLQWALGDYFSALPQSTVAKTPGRTAHTSAEGRLEGVRVGLVEELPDINLDMDMLKQIQGQNPIQAQTGMHKDFKEVRLQLAVLLSSNKEIGIQDNSYGAQRRLRVVPWLRLFSEAEAKPTYADQFAEKYQGAFLAWAIDGAKQYIATGALAECEIIRQETAKKFSDSDVIAIFLGDVGVFDPRAVVSRSDMWQIYERWCRDTGHKPWAAQGLCRALREHGITDASRAGVRAWKGWKPNKQQLWGG